LVVLVIETVLSGAALDERGLNPAGVATTDNAATDRKTARARTIIVK
jgi:hypothetical protein